MNVRWHGVMPAITTPFKEDLSVDHDFLARHCRILVDAGCTGIVPHGSLGESATLSLEEKKAVVETAVGAVGDKVPLIPGIAALSTADAVRLARAAAEAGASGLMILPPYAYSTDWREMKAHVSAVLRATDLPAMLYNNPIAYKTDFLPGQIAELAEEHANLAAVKESSADVRRIMAIRAIVGSRLEILVGVDDGIVEGVFAGAVGWIAGLVDAFPAESVSLFRLAEQVRDWHRRPCHAGGAVYMVPALVADGRCAEVCAADQAGARDDRPWQRESAASASAAAWIGARRRSTDHSAGD